MENMDSENVFVKNAGRLATKVSPCCICMRKLSFIRAFQKNFIRRMLKNASFRVKYPFIGSNSLENLWIK